MIWIGRGNLSTKFRPRLNNQISQFLRSFAFTE
jgi:hypothetical protein